MYRSDKNDELVFIDLVRLGIFDRSLMLRKRNTKSIALQCIGYTIIFYFLSEENGITMMTSIMNVNIPRDITEIGGLLSKVDNLKRMISLYDTQMETRHTRDLEEPASPTENLNRRIKRQRVDTFSLT